MVKLKKGYIKEWLGFVGSRWYFWGVLISLIFVSGYSVNFSLVTSEPFLNKLGSVVSWFFFAAMIPTAIFVKGTRKDKTPKWMYR
jgi:hypothetical protein